MIKILYVIGLVFVNHTLDIKSKPTMKCGEKDAWPFKSKCKAMWIHTAKKLKFALHFNGCSNISSTFYMKGDKGKNSFERNYI